MYEGGARFWLAGTRRYRAIVSPVLPVNVVVSLVKCFIGRSRCGSDDATSLARVRAYLPPSCEESESREPSENLAGGERRRNIVIAIMAARVFAAGVRVPGRCYNAFPHFAGRVYLRRFSTVRCSVFFVSFFFASAEARLSWPAAIASYGSCDHGVRRFCEVLFFLADLGTFRCALVV